MTKIFTDEIMTFIAENYKGKTNQELTDIVNTKFQTNFSRLQIKHYKNRNHLDSGLTGYYSKGSVPWNKGTKGVVKPNSGNFKPGHRSANWKPVGSKRVTRDGYVEIKVSNKPKWKLAHRLLWEKEIGPLKKNEALVFLDGDKTNVSLDNLELITRSELAVINHQVKLEKNTDINKTKIIMARLISARTTAKRKKNK